MSNSENKLAVIYNPASAGGRTGRRRHHLEAALRVAFGEFTSLATEEPAHAVELTRSALREGHDRVISVGGDGTHWEVINGFFEGYLPINPRASLGIVPHGTGSDLPRTLAMPKGIKAVPILKQWRTVSADIGRVTYTLNGGGHGSGYFLNTAHIGMGGEVVHKVNRTTKQWGGFGSFLWGTVVTLVKYENKPIQIEIDGIQIDQICRDIVVANGQYDGGGMHVAPRARLDSGRFEVYVIGDVSRPDALFHLPLLYRGQLEKRADKVKYFKAARITARSPEEVLITLDGEQPGRLPAAIEMVPAALNIVAGPRCRAAQPTRRELEHPEGVPEPAVTDTNAALTTPDPWEIDLDLG